MGSSTGTGVLDGVTGASSKGTGATTRSKARVHGSSPMESLSKVLSRNELSQARLSSASLTLIWASSHLEATCGGAAFMVLGNSVGLMAVITLEPSSMSGCTGAVNSPSVTITVALPSIRAHSAITSSMGKALLFSRIETHTLESSLLGPFMGAAGLSLPQQAPLMKVSSSRTNLMAKAHSSRHSQPSKAPLQKVICWMGRSATRTAIHTREGSPPRLWLLMVKESTASRTA